ncbi:hypothetical protein R3P38DRAFT_3335293 [Favolaschia claudopus]|uniref:Uncharacterized protein n=1 Tax=Favolaschia claudopus TaxID=2862362 RepID=A0AAV9ZAJ2_9AGAR
MKAIVKKALKAKTHAKKEAILMDAGLRCIKHFLWYFRFGDPYAAYVYDTLHSDDLGKLAKHLWLLLLEQLEDLKQKGPFAQNMRKFPRWHNLKHFNAVTTAHFTDGQSFYDILRCVLPFIVQLFPMNDPLIHCIRAYQRFRVMAVANKYGKNFDFFKEHSVNHVVNDIRERGTTNHGSTRPGEGFQQEAREAYEQPTKNHIDEVQEAVARIRMEIDAHDLTILRGEPDENVDETPVDPQSADHWALGAPVSGGVLNSNAYEDAIFVRRFRCPYISYQSLEDWRGARDIIRCNFCFYEEPRYDCLLINRTEPGLHVARTRALLRCKFPSGRSVDIALVPMFQPSRWKPRHSEDSLFLDAEFANRCRKSWEASASM